MGWELERGGVQQRRGQFKSEEPKSWGPFPWWSVVGAHHPCVLISKVSIAGKGKSILLLYYLQQFPDMLNLGAHLSRQTAKAWISATRL